MIRVALYIRVSTTEQKLNGLSLEAQRDALTDYANKHNMHIVGIYADEGITARKRLDKRLEFQRLISDVKQDKIDLILVTKLDRWFRNIKDYYNTQEILEAHNCNWRTIYEKYDTSTSGGRLHINIMLSINQDECDRTSERIKAVFNHKIENKEVVTGSVPLGFKIENKKLVHDNNADMVHDVFQYFILHQNKKATIRYMRDKYNYNMCYASFSNMLKNTLYKGEYKGIKDFCAPYLTDSEFNTIQRAFNKNIRTHKTQVYVYASLLKCKECGHILTGTHTTIKGKVYKSYRCNQLTRGRCEHNKYTNENKIDAFIAANLQKELQGYVAKFEVTANTTDYSKERAAIKRKIKRLKDLYINELIDLKEYKADLSEYNKQLEALPADAVKPDLSRVYDLLNKDIGDLYLSLTDGQKQALIRSVVKNITIDKNNNISMEFL